MYYCTDRCCLNARRVQGTPYYVEHGPLLIHAQTYYPAEQNVAAHIIVMHTLKSKKGVADCYKSGWEGKTTARKNLICDFPAREPFQIPVLSLSLIVINIGLHAPLLWV